ncbi:MAG: PEP-CTERM sorting domain-containing protein [Acidobacteriota bacterium]
MKSLGMLCIFACGAMTVFGTTVSFNTPTGDQGASHTYGGLILATAFGPNLNGNPVHLYGKNDAGNEKGVGLTNDPTGDHEISGTSFIQLDLINILGYLPMSITMNSTTDGEAWKISQSSVSGTLGTNCATYTCWTGTGEGSVSISPTLRYLDIKSTNGNVLLSSISYTQPTPEPVSSALVGGGLMTMYLIRRRRNNSL